MSEVATAAGYGVSPEPQALRFERVLPGPIERVWAYLTQSELRGKWLATGDMELREGGKVELVWRNDDLTPERGARPEGFSAEHRMESRVTRCDPPRTLAFTWQGGGEVTFELAPQGPDVLLTVTHRRVSDRDNLLKVAAGWHAHLAILEDIAAGRTPKAYWSNWLRLKAEYERRLP